MKEFGAGTDEPNCRRKGSAGKIFPAPQMRLGPGPERIATIGGAHRPIRSSEKSGFVGFRRQGGRDLGELGQGGF